MSSAVGGPGGVRTAKDTRGGSSKVQLADPSVEPWMMPYDLYSALMGLLLIDGLRFDQDGYRDRKPNDWRLRFSHNDPEVVDFFMNYFGEVLRFGVPTNDYTRVYTYATLLTTHLHDVWVNEDNKLIMPDHFEQHFTWATLAFWVMRNGFTHGNLLRIGVSTLSSHDKARLMQVLKDKLGLDSYLGGGAKEPYLYIKNIDTFRHMLLPYFHESLLYRITNTPRGQRPARRKFNATQ